MTSGYLSSDRKLKMHQILKASSLEMRIWLWSKFFLEHNVQHILLKSWRSKLSVTWNIKGFTGRAVYQRTRQQQRKPEKPQKLEPQMLHSCSYGVVFAKPAIINHFSTHFSFSFAIVNHFCLNNLETDFCYFPWIFFFFGLNSKAKWEDSSWKGLIGAGEENVEKCVSMETPGSLRMHCVD